ncbi:BRCA1-associated RING domain protein 1 [Cucurbita pepo subsp. pepo]|uniref:BRCA1-associated RING domain protein 1 n=1 Tax=Cucurbita pepo subsp. pepo TaxID=3664 RepID=UPI000C9D9A0A|nr:BRCA1-associated RING domain protein 1 [Cucurbita pepo subsp. pepo]
MADFSSNVRANANTSRFLNPWVLHFQKMGLELKCPLCLSFFDEPVLLPCDHLFCKSCMPFASQIGSECPLCKAGFVDRDLRPAPFMDKMVSIYRSLDATFATNMSKLVSAVDVGATVEKSRFVQSTPCAGPNCKEFQGCSMPADCKCENLDIESRKGSYGRHEDCRMPPVSQTDQLSAGSPPPFGDGKVSDDSSDEYRGHGSKNDSDRRSVIANADDKKLQLSKCTSSVSEEEGHQRDPKRQKFDYGQLKSGSSSVDQTHPPASELGNSETSNSEMEHKSQVTIASNLPLADAEDAIVRNAKCAFCQSSKVTEDTGPVLHYLNGSLVVGVEAANPNVIHAHKLCVDWAPQAYYQGDDVHNLKSEVARGSKLKCSKCGLKGAALGCYSKSCQKSYHVPCALEIEECRWDTDNFLLLCPSHSSARFPDERSKSRKMPRNQASPFRMNQQDSNNWASPSDGVKKWAFCGSALSAEERNILVKFAKISGATVSKFWKPDVTHVIASTSENGACTRTYKVLMGILNGVWILNMDWVKACMKERRPLNEEPYEIALDNYGCTDGPKSGRLRVLNHAPKLFTGLSFYFTSDFPPAYEEDLQDLVITAGGTILENEELAAPSCSSDQAAAPKVLVVYNLDSPGGCKVGEEVSILWQRLNDAEGIAAKVGAQVIGHTWLVESIAAGNLQPFVSC